MIDTHAHLYLSEFSDDIDLVLERAKAAGVEKVLLPNVDLLTADSMLSLAKKHPGYMLPMMGLHPTSVNDNYLADLASIQHYFDNNHFCAVGEIGIDLYWDKTYLKQQEEAFSIQIGWALERDLPIVIHARDSFPEIIEVLKDFKGRNLRGVFHSFTGGEKEVNDIEQLGDFYFGINGIVTFKNSDLYKVLERIGLNRLLLETDAPYLSPVPYRGKRNESSYVKHVRDKIAAVLNEDVLHVTETTTQNANKLFRLSND